MFKKYFKIDKIIAFTYFSVSAYKLKETYFRKVEGTVLGDRENPLTCGKVEENGIERDYTPEELKMMNEKFFELKDQISKVSNVKIIPKSSYYSTFAGENNYLAINVDHFLKENEMGVIYHELGHVVNNDSRSLFVYHCVKDLVCVPFLIVFSPTTYFFFFGLGSLKLVNYIWHLRIEKRADLFSKEHGYGESHSQYLSSILKNNLEAKQKGEEFTEKMIKDKSYEPSSDELKYIIQSHMLTKNGNFILDYQHPPLTERIRYLKN